MWTSGGINKLKIYRSLGVGEIWIWKDSPIAVHVLLIRWDPKERMRFTKVKLENWRNFLGVEVSLERRVFLVGPNASGKSNFLDAFRFLRDIADAQGGFQWAVDKKRGGVSQIRSLHARRHSNIAIEVEVDIGTNGPWTYRLEFNQDNRKRPIIRREVVTKDGELVLERPDDDDREDEKRLTQTHLEQLNANRPFRELQEFLAKVRYLHLVPHLVREPDRSVGRTRDPYGGDFLEQLATTNKRTLASRLRRITEALKIAVPQLEQLELHRDEKGVPHLRGLHRHWRPKAGWADRRTVLRRHTSASRIALDPSRREPPSFAGRA